MTFTKKKLAAAMTGTLLASGGIETAQAVPVDMDLVGTAELPIVYASEIAIGATGTTLTANANTMDIVGVNNVLAIATNTQVRTTLTLSSGTFDAAPTMLLVASDLDDTGCVESLGTAHTCPVPAQFSGGTTADSTVTFQMATTTQTVAAGAHFNIALNGITVPNQSAITATVGVVIADNFGPTTLASNSGQYLKFSPSLALVADTTGSVARNIDVTQNSLFFSPTTGGATGQRTYNVGGAILTEAGTLTTVASAANPVSAATVALTANDIIASTQHTITAANGFSAMAQGTAVGVAGGGIAVGGHGNAAISTADATIAVTGTVAMIAGGETIGFNAVTLSLPAALTPNTVVIAETTLTDTVTSVAKTNYTNTSSSGTIALRSLTRNGSSARLTFAVNPTSAYPMSIRVTNPTAIVGTATLQLINDDGDTSAAIDLSAIAGGPAGNTLAANSSTALLSIADVFAAVTAADATFTLGTTSNKLRVAVSASLPTVVLNAFTVSSDGTTFSMVTDAGA